MSNKVIGLVGVKTSGKSTVAEMIKSLVPGAVELALADKLKNTCTEVFDLERKYFDDQNLKEVPFDAPKKLGVYEIGATLESFGIYMSIREIDSKFKVAGMRLNTPRQIMTIVGTEILRQAGNEDIHCYNVSLNNNVVNIISDIRFPNEYGYFENKESVDFLPLYIHRLEAESKVSEESHPSEKMVFELKNKCVIIDNNGSIENTKNQVYNVLKNLEFINKEYTNGQ